MDVSQAAQVDALVQAATAPAQTAAAVDVAVLGQVLDMAKTQNGALLDMMRDTLSASLGQTLDVRF
ncbi:MAG: putative motility protein [Acidimicrobiia bacterium]|nr:putative motility protein [Acidimicrobiia bacterium]MDH4306970.1 putative motility protein [Acidimicrobiia bacterium]MDH5294010.1 putative motility protein [Acidimicrobiia bacterium]